jgi:hypothetical protein
MDLSPESWCIRRVVVSGSPVFAATAKGDLADLGRATNPRGWGLRGPGWAPADTVIHMTTYSGPATLILANGARVTGMASLGTNNRGNLNGWSGTFRPNEVNAEVRNATDGLQLELPYEQIGTVAVTNVRRLLATQVLMSLAGTGPAPF